MFDEAWCSIFEDFQLQNVHIMFLFFHEKCLITTKVTLVVNNCLLFL